jgi:hypothetical protein
MGSSEYSQGIYTIKNKEKYIGKKPPFFRSSWELKYMHFLDNNEKVQYWCTECMVVPYMFGGKTHNYFVDFMVIYKDGKKMAVEIKPSRETRQPRKTKAKSRKTMIYEQLTYLKNTAKWTAAKDFCSKRNIEFRIITEKDSLI